VVSISVLLSLSRRLGRVFAYVGSGSIFVLIFHWLFMDAVKLLFDSIMPSIPHVTNWLVLVLAVIMPLVLFEISKKQWLLSMLLLPRKSGS